MATRYNVLAPSASSAGYAWVDESGLGSDYLAPSPDAAGVELIYHLRAEYGNYSWQPAGDHAVLVTPIDEDLRHHEPRLYALRACELAPGV